MNNIKDTDFIARVACLLAEKEKKVSHKIIKSGANQYNSHCAFVSEFKLEINPNSSN